MNESTSNRRNCMLALFFFLFMVLTWQYWPEGKTVLQQLLFQGDLEVLAEAFDHLVLELEWGTSLSGALEVFCREILNNGTAVLY